MDELTWGLLPHDTNPNTCPRPLHARGETVAELPIFADAFRRRRAIIPADVFSERGNVEGNEGRKFYFVRDDGNPMALAGLWESFVWPGGQIERTYCIITTEPNELMAPYHDRMPVILEPADWPLWLGEVDGDPATLLRPAAPGVLRLDERGAPKKPKGSRYV